MKKVLLFSLFLVLGLVVSQMLPAMVGEQYSLVKTISNTFLFICLAFIMINVGREFEIDKTRWKSYTEDYFIAMATAAFPWIFVALYYMFVLLPGDLWGSWDAWKENLLLSRFAAPTSAGILFTMLAAAGLKASWVYKKVQVLAIFDDLDTILLMIPLQIMMIGLRWQLGVIILVVVLLLILGWKKMGYYNVRQDWKAILFSGLIVAYRTAAAEAISAAEIEERTVDEDITVVFEYPYLNGIMRIVKEDNPAIISQKFEMDCEMTLRIRKGEAERLKNRLLKVETAYLKE